MGYKLEVTGASEVLRVVTICYLLVKYTCDRLSKIMLHIIVKCQKMIENVHYEYRL